MFKQYLNVCRRQLVLSRPAARSWTPESCKSLLLRSSSVKLDKLEVRIDPSILQILWDRLQSANLI